MTCRRAFTSALPVLAIALVAAGCSGSKTTTRTVTVARPATSTTTTTSTATTATKAASTTTSATPELTAEEAARNAVSAAIPPALDPVTPQNFRATEQLRSDIVRAGNDYLRTHSHEAITGSITRTEPGSIYLARWGGHEYAFAGLHAPSEFDVVGTFIRVPGTAWTAADVGPASDVGPACAHPPALLRLWFQKSMLQSCHNDPSRLISIPGGAMCEVQSGRLLCGTLDHGYDTKALQHVATLDADGSTGSAVDHAFGDGLDDGIYGATMAGYNVRSSVTGGGHTFTCTSVPDSLACTGPGGGTISVPDIG